MVGGASTASAGVGRTVRCRLEGGPRGRHHHWASAEDLSASDELAEEAHAKVEATVRPSRGPIVDRYEIVVRKP
jgi:hypothetical protein